MPADPSPQVAEFRGVRVRGANAVDVVSLVGEAVRDRSSLLVTFVNPHSFNLIAHDSGGEYLRDLGRMLVLADGMGVVWAIRATLAVRLARLSFDLLAPELFRSLAAVGAPVYFVGGMPGVAERAAARLASDYAGLKVVGVHDGFMPRDAVAETARSITASGATVVIVGAGAPIQERLAAEIEDVAGPLAIITCGGYFDQAIRSSPYYPRWAYPLRLNWLVRLVREPRRLWYRYLIGTPRFALDTIRWALRARTRSDDLGR